MASDILDRVGMVITTTGTGDVTANVLISNRFNTPAEAGAANGKSYWWMLEEESDYQIFEGVWTAAGTKVARTTTWQSKIAGVHGAANMNLAGNATLRSITPAELFDVILRVDKAQALSLGQKSQALDNLGGGAVGKTLFGAADAASAWTPLDASAPASAAFRRGNILGTVSQSGGVPTGAVVETGSNANGKYALFADGTQWCWNDIVVTDQAIANANGSYEFFGDRTMTFPKSFIAAPNVSVGRFSVDSNRTWGCVSGAPTTTTVLVSGYSPLSLSAGSVVRISYVAIGRWF